MINAIQSYIKATKYNIGFVEGSLQSVVDGNPIHVNWMKHPYRDRWFADPFILDVTDDEIIVLVEEWYDLINRGRITRLIIDKETFELKNLKPLIDEGTHLSFPAVERVGDDIFIYPERAGTKLESYIYRREKDCLEKVGLVSDLPLTDSVINDLFGQRLLFSTRLPDANGKELGIYSWDAEQESFVLKEFYHFDDNISRMAGNFFTCSGKIFRPAQVCIKSYGDAVSIQEVKHENGKWCFREVRRIYSPDPDLDLGFHTLNTYKDVIVVDAVGYRRARLCHFLRKLKGIIKKWKIK